MSENAKVWLVTGASSGFGRAIAEAAAAIRLALDAEKTPLRLAFGGDAVDFLTAHLDSVRAELNEWEETSRGTDFDTE
ncbi:hypothetical protein ACWGDX_11285 [Streptomyces sp. NPDC055025]